MTLAAPDGSVPASLAPVDCHRACAPPNDELLVDNCFERDGVEAGERCENVDEPVRSTQAMSVSDYDPEVTQIPARVWFA